MEKSSGLNVQNLIERLLSAKKNKVEKEVPMTEVELSSLAKKARAIFIKEKIVVDVKGPVSVCGDIHGQFYDLLRLFEMGGIPPDTKYLFLGDYVDRGKQNLETIGLLLAFKVAHPDKITLLRGNHEASSINKMYGFYDECKRRFSVKLWKVFSDCFNCMPVCGLVEKKILCMHGGLSPDMNKLSDLDKVFRPLEIPDSGMLCDLVWSDPSKTVRGWVRNDRGVSYAFGVDILQNFLKKNKLDLICRAHQVVEDGYEFFGKRSLVTIFSAPNYCGEFDNNGGLMTINDKLMCSFKILKPKAKKKKSGKSPTKSKRK